jgi:hypothetical protein
MLEHSRNPAAITVVDLMESRTVRHGFGVSSREIVNDNYYVAPFQKLPAAH